jgi:C-terminal processing protease CtpA/Prc
MFGGTLNDHSQSMKANIALAVGALAISLAALAEDIGTPGLVILERKNKDEPLRTANAVPGSPAAGAGIKSPGFLISVDGTNVVNMPFSEALGRVRGKVGTSVILEIADSTMHQTNKYTLKRGKLVTSNGKLEVTDR